jgi:hypothetical protein
LADFLEGPHQQFYAELKEWSVYHVKKMLLRFMVKQVAEKLKPRASKSVFRRWPFFGLKMPKPSLRCRVVPYFQ